MMLGVPDGKIEWDLKRSLVVYRDAKGRSLGRRRPRGGVCWPKMVARGFGGGGVEGFACVLMEDPDAGVVWVSRERPFMVVEDVIRDNKVEIEGICRWLDESWRKCGCDTYFCMTETQTNLRYQLQAIRSGFVERKPQFVNLEFADCSQAEHCLFEWLSIGKLKFAKDGAVHKALRGHVVGRGMAEAAPAVEALMAGAAGLERFPCRV